MSLIAIQENYIARLIAAHAKIGKRSAGLMFARTSASARKEAAMALAKIGYSEPQAKQIIQDARDMFALERDARR